MSDRIETLLDDAERTLDALAEETEDVELRSVLEELGILLRVANEAEDLLETIDLSELPEAIDGEELLAAVDVGEIPAALEEGDGEDVVKLRQLVRAVKLTKLWDGVDLQRLWREKREFDDAVDELTGDDDGGIVREAIDGAAAAVSDDDESDLLDEVDEIGDELKAGATEAFGSAEDALEDGNLSEYQTILQHQAMVGIDELRDALIETHGAFERLYDENRKRMRRTDRSTSSRNPTAVSTMPVARAEVGSSALYSTVPKAVRYSTAPPHDRIYGQRFKREREKRRKRGDEKAE